MTDEELPAWAAPRPLGPGWWFKTFAGLVVTLVLLAVLATALSVLTRMLVEGTTQPEPHPPTVLVWFGVCIVTIFRGMVRNSWRELGDERVHVGAFGEEVRIDRWPTAQERARYAELVASSTGAPGPSTQPVVETPSGETTSDEIAADETAADEGPDGEDVEPSGPRDRLESLPLACLVGWLPLVVVLAVGSAVLPQWIARGWTAAPLALLPVGWVLLESHHLLRHRRLRTARTRSDLAGLHVVTALFGVVLFGTVALTGLIMREEYPGVVLIAVPVAVLCGWLVRRELRHVRRDVGDEPSREG